MARKINKDKAILSTLAHTFGAMLGSKYEGRVFLLPDSFSVDKETKELCLTIDAIKDNGSIGTVYIYFKEDSADYVVYFLGSWLGQISTHYAFETLLSDENLQELTYVL